MFIQPLGIKKNPEEPEMASGKVLDDNPLNKTPYLQMKTFLAVAIAITTMTLAIVAHQELAAVSGDVFDVIDNWKRKPVVNMTVIGRWESCPDGWSDMSLSNADFPGIGRGHCGCVLPELSHLQVCSEEEEETPNCMSYASKPSVDVSSWRESKICFLRGGEPSESWDDGYRQRPHPNSDGVCENGYHKCGQGLNHNDDRAICFPNEAEVYCPLTNIVVAEYIPEGDGWIQLGSFDDDYELYGRREGLGEFPIVDFQLKLSSDVGDGFRDGESYSTGDQDRGPCYTGVNQVLDTKLDVSTSTEWDISANYPKSCKRVDTRYFLYESYSLQNLYLETFRNNVPECENFDLYTIDDSRYSSASDPDYLNSGFPCGTGNYVCERPEDQLTSCSSFDSICDGVVFQNSCGHYAHGARSLSETDNTFGFFARRQIFWDENCPVDQDRLFSGQDPLTTALDALLALLVISVIFSVCMIVLSIKAMCELQGKHGVYLKVTRKEQFSVLAAFLIIGPLIAALVTVRQIAGLYEEVGNGECSDSLTNYTFKFLADEFPQIYHKTVGQIVIQCTLFSVTALMLFRKMKKIKQGSQVSPENAEKSGSSQVATMQNSALVTQQQSGTQVLFTTPQQNMHSMVMIPQQGYSQPVMGSEQGSQQTQNLQTQGNGNAVQYVAVSQQNYYQPTVQTTGMQPVQYAFSAPGQQIPGQQPVYFMPQQPVVQTAYSGQYHY